jgi:hypothetical protein
VPDQVRALGKIGDPLLRVREPDGTTLGVCDARRRRDGDRDAREAVPHRLAERTRDRDELEEAVVGGERDARALRVDGLERARHEGIRGGDAVGRGRHARDRVLEQRDARQRALSVGRVDDDAPERHPPAGPVVEAEEAGFGRARLAGAFVATRHGDAVDGLAAVEDRPHDRFELVGEHRHHVAQGAADVLLDRGAVQLREPVVDRGVAQFDVERGEPDRRGATETDQ